MVQTDNSAYTETTSLIPFTCIAHPYGSNGVMFSAI